MHLKLLAVASVAAAESTPTICPHGSCADTQRESSVLMQRLNRRGRQMPLKVAKQATPAKENRAEDLYQVAAQMLREGTTNDAFDFANDTLTQLEEVVLPALMNGYEDDKKLLEEMMDEFVQASSTFAGHKTEIEQLQSQEAAASHDHKQCRDSEVHNCDTAITCETERSRLWTIYTETQTDYLSIVRTIKHQWCEVSGNRSEAEWRESTERRFEHFISVGEEHITKLEAHDEWATKCEQGNHSLDEALAICDGLKSDLEHKSCAREAAYDSAMDQLDITWTTASQYYAEIVAAVQAREHIRHLEFKSLKGIKCLLKHIVERSLKACSEDEEPGEYETIVEECESYWQIDVELLLNPWNLTYPEIPERPEAPPHGLEPCSEQYIAAHYAEWDGMPCFDSMPHCTPCAVTPILPVEPPVTPQPEPHCTGGLVWNDCGSACPPTCENQHPECTRQCIARCECPTGMLLQEGLCISEPQCAHHEDTENFVKHVSTFIEGHVLETMTNVDNSQECAEKCNTLEDCQAFRYFTSPHRGCVLLSHVQTADGVHEEEMISFTKKTVQEIIFADFGDQPEFAQISFANMDTNSDDQIAEAEFDSFMDGFRAYFFGFGFNFLTAERKQELSHETFVKLDKDANGHIDGEEAKSYKDALYKDLLEIAQTGSTLNPDVDFNAPDILMQMYNEVSVGEISVDEEFGVPTRIRPEGTV